MGGLENAHIRQTQNYPSSEDVTEAGGADYSTKAKSTEHSGGGHGGANTGIFDGEFAKGDRQDIADQHGQPHRRTPVRSAGNNSQEI